MVHIGKSLITSHYTGVEFSRDSVLNEGIVIGETSMRHLRAGRREASRRKKNQARAGKAARF